MSSKLNLKIITVKGVVYENSVDAVKIRRSDGVMIINRNYFSVLEQLVKGPIVVIEEGRRITMELLESGWMTMSSNVCNIYSSFVKLG